MRVTRLHFSEVMESDLDRDVVATRYFPLKSTSQATTGINHIAPLCEQLVKLRWIEASRRRPYMYRGRQTSAVEYERGRSRLILTIYKEGAATWAFVKVMGYGADVIELRDWMMEYETGYGRVPLEY